MSTKKDTQTGAEAVKRKPGRPRKKVLKPSPKRQGLMDTPDDDKNLIEMLYDKPIIFKKMGTYWKSLNAEKIQFTFTPTHLLLYTKNYKGTNDAIITCDGSKLNQYHCSKNTTIGINFSNLELILNKLDKSYETISFVIQKKKANKTLHIILQNEVNIPEFFEVDIILEDPEAKNEVLFQDLFVNPIPYELEFKLPGKYFKKMISDTKAFESQWTIEKYGDTGNLAFSYKSGNGQVKGTVVPKSLKDIGLKSLVKNGEMFSVSIYIDTIRPTSSSQLADVINIRASKDKPLWIWAELDEKTIMVNVLIKIVDHRPNVNTGNATPNKQEAAKIEN